MYSLAPESGDTSYIATSLVKHAPLLVGNAGIFNLAGVICMSCQPRSAVQHPSLYTYSVCLDSRPRVYRGARALFGDNKP